MAFADSEPKLIAEMLKTLAEYGWSLPSPTSTRKSAASGRVGAIE